MKKLMLIILALCLIMTSGCIGARENRYQAQFLSLFDTVTTIVGYSESEARFKEFAGQVKEELEKYHQLYDIYNSYEGISNIKTINDNAGVAPVKVDSRIIDMLLFARELFDRTDGAVNVAMGSVLRIWHDYREEGTDDPENAKLPPIELLREAAQHTDLNSVVINKDESTVFIPDSKMRLDVGAVAKGYATEQVALHFEGQGIKSLLLSVGGNVRAIGSKLVAEKNGEKRWVVAVQNPDKSNSISDIFSLLIDGHSVVSSGDYARYYTVDGVEYHHIINSETLMPADYYAQVTIVCRDSGLADALSTALFNMPIEQGRSLLDSIGGVAACWVLHNGGIEYSQGFKKYINAEQ